MKNKNVNKKNKDGLMSTSKKTKKKLTLAERQEIKLKRQKARQAAKIANGEAVPKNKDRFYCTSAELTAELIKWRDSNLEEEQKRIKAGLEIDYAKRKVSEELGRMFIAIADKMLNRSEFRNYPKQLKEDAKGYFFYRVMKDGLRNYNFKFNNPFAYFTTCAWNAYIATIMKQYRHQNAHKEVMKQLLSELESQNGIDPHSSLNNYLKRYIESDSYVQPVGKQQ